MHGDEANQAVKAGALLDSGVYRYDPEEHHGPALYYSALISARLGGTSRFSDTTESTFRIVPVFFGVLLILLLIPLRGALGPQAAVFAGLFTAVSPAFVYYSRYFIQEMLLVFFTFGVLVAGWNYVRRRSLPWALATGFFLGLMHATKETAVIAYGSMVGAVLLTAWWARRDGEAVRPGLAVNPRHAAAAAVVAVGVSVVLYSSFFTHGRGPLDSILAYGNYFHRAGAAGIHDKPWSYYLELLAFVQRRPGPWWSEGIVLVLALVGAWSIVARKEGPEGDRSFLRFLVVYTALMTLAYSAIPYKTPWCALGFLHGPSGQDHLHRSELLRSCGGIGFAGTE